MSTITPSFAQTPSLNGTFQRNLRAVLLIWYRDLLRYARDWPRIITSLVQPLLYLFIFGSGLASSLDVTGGSSHLDFRTFLFPGILSMTVMFTALFSAISIVWDREFGFLREVLVAPISRASVVVGKALGGSTIAIIPGLIMLLFAPLVGVSLNPGLVVQLLLEMLLLAFSLTALGILLASGMKSMQGFQMLIQFLLMPLFFLSGALFPLKNLPGWLAVLNRLDPVTYGVDPLRQAVLENLHLPPSVTSALGMGIELFGHSLSVAEELGIMAALGLLFLVWATHSFSKQE